MDYIGTTKENEHRDTLSQKKTSVSNHIKFCVLVALCSAFYTDTLRNGAVNVISDVPEFL